ncbi:response regulator PleD [gamma proteobacterium HTCC5015]|nr:response regulator PleD [gamma proteobacterium HTCC5015]
MSQTRSVKVCAIGLPATDLSVLARALSVSAGRERRYELIELDDVAKADILFVHIEAQNSEAFIQAEQTRPVPVVVMGPKEESFDSPYFAVAPLMASRLLKVLDQVPLNDHGSAAAHVQRRQDDSHQDYNPSAKRALVVDDSAPVRKQLEVGLKAIGVEADFASNGDEALIKLSQAKFDIVFLDVVMPGKDGFTICKLIKKNPTTKDVPVIMLTGRTAAMDKVKGSLAGCQAYLTKPIDDKQFQATVEKFVV